jgi:hypothetical protein
MTRALSFKEEAALRSAGAVDIVCGGADSLDADQPKVFRLSGAMAQRITGETDLAVFVSDLIKSGLVLPGFVMPSRFCPNIVLRASPNIRKILGAAKGEQFHNER